MRGNGKGPPELPDDALWQRSRVTDIAENDAERFLDLAGFADGLLDPDERERVAELIAANPALAEDIAATRAGYTINEAPRTLVARALALLGGDQADRNVVPFPTRPRLPALLREAANWAGLAAAMLVAGWLGFTLGIDTSLSLARGGQSADEGVLQQMLDPSPGFMSEGTQT